MKISIILAALTGAFETDMNRAAKTTQRRAKEIEKDLTRTFKVAAAAAATFATAIGAAVLNATIEAERVQAQLAAAIKSTGGAAGLTQKELNAMAEQLQNVTTFGDEAINSAQALLLTFTKIGRETFPDAIEAALDMSTALGTDLQSAVTQIGKALNDPIKGVTALGRAGVQFSEDQKSMIEALVETGRLAEAQTIILAELETQFGGSAVAARDTLGGALEALKNTVGNLLEGDTGGDGLFAAKEAVEALNTQFSSAQVKSAFAGAIEEASKQLAGLVGWLIKWDTIAGEMLKKADTANAFNSYRESMAGLTEEGGELQKRIKEIEAGGLTGDPFASREESVGKLRDRLREVRIELAGMWKEQNAGQAAGGDPIAAAIDLAGNRARLLATSGENHIIGAGDSQFEFGLSPRGGSAVSRAAAEAAKLQADADRDAAAAKRERESAEASYTATVENLVAMLGGPLKEVELDYIRREDELIKLAELAGLSNEELQRSLGYLEQARLKDVAAIDAQIEAEKARAQAIKDAGTIAAMDDFRYAFEDNVASVLDGTQSIRDALESMVDAFIAQMARAAAQDFAASLFGSPGGKGGGMFGDALGGFWAMFGGGKAAGGPVMAGVPYLIGEQGPELIIPSASGTVIPAGKTAAMLSRGRGDMTVIVQGATSRRALDRLRVERQREQNRATGEFA